ncbi:MAG: DUF1801 domain-containing protein [Planctomycetota bacterium]
MKSSATTVDAYLASLPADRREAIEAVRAVVRKNLDRKIAEGVQYGMVGWFVPHSVYPAGYHCDPKQPLPFASLASQKSHMALYLFCIYGDAEEKARFVEEWKATGKKLDMGASCVRFKKLEDVPLDVVGRAIERMTRWASSHTTRPLAPRARARSANRQRRRRPRRRSLRRRRRRAPRRRRRRRAPPRRPQEGRARRG